MLRPSVVLNLNLMDQEAHLLLTSIHISCLSNRDLKLFTEHVVADFSCVEVRTTRWLKKYFRTCSLASPWYKQFHVVTSEYAGCGRQLEESCFVNYIFAIAIQNLVSLDEI